jgi:hypothetical protein
MSIFYLLCHHEKGEERVLGTDPAQQKPLQKRFNATPTSAGCVNPGPGRKAYKYKPVSRNTWKHRKEKEMTNINESKVLLETEFEDSLQEGWFDVKITRHFSNIVLGECVEVKIEHDTDQELCLNATYQPNEFPEKFYRDLDLRGWSWVLAEIRERL